MAISEDAHAMEEWESMCLSVQETFVPVAASLERPLGGEI